MIADKDLLSMQYARILAENAQQAQRVMASFPQERLDAIVERVAKEVEREVDTLAGLSYDETEYGREQDKAIKNRFACKEVLNAIRPMRCVGIISEHPAQGLMEVGVPVGVIAALCPVTSPVSTTIYKTLLAIKSGNAIIFSPHPRAAKCMGRALDIMRSAALDAGLPEGALTYLNTVTKAGTAELMQHPAVTMIMLTGVPGMLEAAKRAGKPLIYGGLGHGPAFIERSADIRQAVEDIIASKSFDNGIAPSAEQSVVVDAAVAAEVKRAFQEGGAYFMTQEESERLASHFFTPDGRCKSRMVGVSAADLARKANLPVDDRVKLLVAERQYVSGCDPYTDGFLSPVLAYYVEDNWEYACEKCIELLLHEKNGHTLVIHSNNQEVIRQFALKKPVGRMLVNTPAAFGGVGDTTPLFPALTLGSGSAGQGITSDNVSPMNLVYIRKVGYGVRKAGAARTYNAAHVPSPSTGAPDASSTDTAIQVLQRILTEAIGPK